MSHFLCTVLLGFSVRTPRLTGNSSAIKCGCICFSSSESFLPPQVWVSIHKCHILRAHPTFFFSPSLSFSETPRSLDLIVFSLLLPRLSTSPRPPCQKTQLSGMSLGPIHRKRGETATEAKTDDTQMFFFLLLCFFKDIWKFCLKFK